MKRFLSLSFAAALISSSLYGTTVVPNPDAHRIFLKKERVGGFVPSSMAGYKDELRVYKNGRVTTYKKANKNARPVEKDVGTINIFVLRKLQKDINAADFSELVTDESKPMCTDVPSTYYSSPLLGKTFASSKNCRAYFPKNSDYYILASNLISLLNGLSTLETEAEDDL